MTTEAQAGPRSGGVWLLAVTGPLAWFGAHVAGWVITPAASSGGRAFTLRGIQIGALVLAVLATVASIIVLVRHRAHDQTLERVHRMRWLMHCAVVLCAMSSLLILGNLIVTIILSPGQEP